ncbi:MAG TPA: hypothetical protein P5511_09165, partial [Candidatus Goldiibacteriota bacterium]|nr:hypothetical protein [Candidatus Goldiibacteriota bacterium]
MNQLKATLLSVSVILILLNILVSCGERSPSSPSAPKNTLTATCTSTTTSTPTNTRTPHYFTIADSTLDASVRATVGIPQPQPLSREDIASVYDLYVNGGVSTLSGIENLTGLMYLTIQNCPLLTDISPLSSLTGLITLSLHGCTAVTDISPLIYLTSLSSLYLGAYGDPSSKIPDLTPLDSLTGLYSLHMQGRSLTNSDLTYIFSHTSLTSLDLSGNPGITDISGVSALTSLTYLILSGTGISDISSLSGLLNLNQLLLRYCASLENISALVTNALAGGLGSGDRVFLEGTVLSAQGEADAETLINTYGVQVYYTP